MHDYVSHEVFSLLLGLGFVIIAPLLSCRILWFSIAPVAQ